MAIAIAMVGVKKNLGKIDWVASSLKLCPEIVFHGPLNFPPRMPAVNYTHIPIIYIYICVYIPIVCSLYHRFACWKWCFLYVKSSLLLLVRELKVHQTWWFIWEGIIFCQNYCPINPYRTLRLGRRTIYGETQQVNTHRSTPSLGNGPYISSFTHLFTYLLVMYLFMYLSIHVSVDLSIHTYP